MHTHSITIHSLTADERQSLAHLAHSPSLSWSLRDAAILALLLETGMRASELCALPTDALGAADGDRVPLTINGAKGGIRRVLLTNETAALLHIALCAEMSGQPFSGRTWFFGGSSPLAPAEVDLLVRRAGVLAGLAEPLTVRRLRQTVIAAAWMKRGER